MPIAKLPPLPGGIWTSVLVALSAQLERMTNSDYKPLFVVYEDVGKNSIYAQGSVSPESRYLLEIQSNTFLDEKLTDRDVQVLRILGWQLPNDANPNYWRECPQTWSIDLVALTIIQALERIGRLNPSSWFSFGSDPFGVQLAKSGAFWAKIGNSGLLCLPGQNSSEAGPI